MQQQQPALLSCTYYCCQRHAIAQRASQTHCLWPSQANQHYAENGCKNAVGGPLGSGQQLISCRRNTCFRLGCLGSLTGRARLPPFFPRFLMGWLQRGREGGGVYAYVGVWVRGWIPGVYRSTGLQSKRIADACWVLLLWFLQIPPLFRAGELPQSQLAEGERETVLLCCTPRDSKCAWRRT